jgi:Xaa-Pro aminopeptidase
MIVRSGRNVAYLSGMSFPGTLGRLQDFAYSPRAAVLVWSRRSEPVLFVSAIARGLAERQSWLENLRSYTEYSESPFVLSASFLKQQGLDQARIGIEYREFGAEHWDAIRAELPGAQFVDCTDLLEGVRNIKTPGELDLIRQAAAIQDQAHLDVFGTARPGTTERELHSRMVAAMIASGADSAHGMLQASTNPVTYGGEGDVPINHGDVVRTDYVCYFQGYAANLSRMAVMGKPSAEQERIYQTLVDVHRETIHTMFRAGVAARDVYNFVVERFRSAGFPEVASLVGHSLGVWWHQEEPMLVPTESRQLRPGMVLCLEPILNRFWHLQDEVLVTGSEPELISTLFNTDQLFVMG